MDLDAYDKRVKAMLTLLEVAAGQSSFSVWSRFSESISASKTEKLEYYLKILYNLLEDVLVLQQGHAPRHSHIADTLEQIARLTTFEWLSAAVRKVDELVEMARRNVQKGIALDAFAVELRRL